MCSKLPHYTNSREHGQHSGGVDISQPTCPRCKKRPKAPSTGYCRDCRNAYRRDYYRKNHKKAKQQVRVDAWKRQGIDLTWEQYEQLLADQNHECAACHQPPGNRALHVDHNHTTGHIRGLLCGNCNQALGYAQENPTILQALADYIHQTEPNNQTS